MTLNRSCLIAKYSPFLTLAVCVLVIREIPVTAQLNTPPPRTGSNSKRQMQERQLSEANLRGAGAEAEVAKLDEHRINAGIKQTKEDFRRIQLIRNDMVDGLLARKPLDYRLIAEQAAELHHRADRLRTFLLPPVKDEEKKRRAADVELDDAQMTSALVKLCNVIYRFTQNPVLKSLGTTDVQESTRAGGDLLTIIELSERIQKNADRLKKK
jgi:hypothetical protein